MISNDVDMTPDDRSVTRADKITYKTTLQRLVENCLVNMRNPSIRACIDSLTLGVYFSIPGLPFKRDIDLKREELDKEMNLWLKKRIHKCSDGIYYFPECMEDLCNMDADIVSTEFMFRKNREMFIFLMDLLARHDVLVQPRDFVESGGSE